MKTFYSEVKGVVHDWAKGGYNEDYADVFTKLSFLLKEYKWMCEECIYKNIWKQNEK